MVIYANVNTSTSHHNNIISTSQHNNIISTSHHYNTLLNTLLLFLREQQVEQYSEEEYNGYAVLLNISVACVKPRPTLSERLTITMLRCEKPVRAIIPKPA